MANDAAERTRMYPPLAPLFIGVFGFDLEPRFTSCANPIVFPFNEGVVVDAFAVIVAEVAGHRQLFLHGLRGEGKFRLGGKGRSACALPKPSPGTDGRTLKLWSGRGTLGPTLIISHLPDVAFPTERRFL